MIKFENVKMIQVRDWDKLVEETYGRPYDFQQQGDCKHRGIVHITVPSEDCWEDDEFPESIPEVVNGEEMGVKFESWLSRDPKQLLPGKDDQNGYSLGLFWGRNFYPSVHSVINDLHAKGLLPEGDYIINIDW